MIYGLSTLSPCNGGRSKPKEPYPLPAPIAQPATIFTITRSISSGEEAPTKFASIRFPYSIGKPKHGLKSNINVLYFRI